MQLLGCKSSGKRILHQSFLDKPVFIPGFCWEGWLDPLVTSLFFPIKGCPATSWESKNDNLHYNSTTCNTSVWLLFVFVAEISAPQLQEVRISFRADIEPCRSFMLQWSGDFEALNSSLSFPTSSSTVRSSESLSFRQKCFMISSIHGYSEPLLLQLVN